MILELQLWHWVAILFSMTFALLGITWALKNLYQWLKVEKQGYPNEDEWEEALLPYLYQAIMAAYKASEYMVDVIGDRLHGADKTKLAREIYKYLPDLITIGGVAWNWKDWISEDLFAEWTEARFEGFIDLWDMASEELLELLDPENGTVTTQ